MEVVTRKGLPRWLEAACSLCGLVALSPLFLVCALIVRLSSPGPVLFRQKRVGLRGTGFNLYKFRTMVVAGRGALVTATDDSRITPAGRFLRKTKLDELPELFNVLTGDMSFVGPRPEVPEFVDLTDARWRELLSVRPGITDPTTLHLRNEEAFLAMVEDKEAFYREVLQPFKIKRSLKYLRRRTARSDVRIILQTIKAIFLPQTSPKPVGDELYPAMTD